MYIPSDKILYNYARILIDFALGAGKGIKKEQIVYVHYDSPAHPLALQVYRRILEKGGYPITKVSHEDFSKVFYTVASEAQLKFFPAKYMKSLVDTIDHRIYLLSHDDPLYLKQVDPKKIVMGQTQLQRLRKWIWEKEEKGKLTWTLCLYGTAGMARQAGLTEAEYWEQIEKACFLKEADPLESWRAVFGQINKTLKKLNALSIDKLHLTAKDTDLWIKLGADRQFIGGRGANIPSFEIFTSPDWRGTEGHIYFDLPLYRYGTIASSIHLTFKKGKIIKVKASKNEKLIKELVSQPNADKVGEYSLTDKRFSKIDKFMANTLFDENFGGDFGNTHLAVGSSYHDAYRGDVKKMKSKDWGKLGFNESVEHTDMMATHNRTVEVTLINGVKKIIYKDGEFVV
ncbi:thermophilic metalloprotease (M29) superfamily [Candidatus Roizmanbacteria bacterium RIFCSPHIGHO2_01_FULL_39_12b]|uniref:Thermophilic metalloprotease (M29) superfamily n=1 Tax=Candidatus Roizmanbacteria bacterium RIFCSPHIGHO2_01_FULL_39_12b TaxID=1802030 RepID=A0A1F7GBJ8_9BACT|nr:MAG: thermophilic metalloprotease (M29) superfamily [Candidatus Roizmanbacteria bacterium RIFCSPHIGHO2_01_FULL_39_12b]